MLHLFTDLVAVNDLIQQRVNPFQASPVSIRTNMTQLSYDLEVVIDSVSRYP